MTQLARLINAGPTVRERLLSHHLARARRNFRGFGREIGLTLAKIDAPGPAEENE
jgi:hypothetical protein